ncbi:MAG: RNA 2'-phosphotransferase [Spirochaetaceae bacterium]|nr:MAG: RNA 2'-phosphotransferase [Spirochaetaceae bacterium]
MDDEVMRTSKFLSLVLRHKPEAIGLQLDKNGWANVEELLSLSAEKGRNISMDMLLRVVRENDRHRFMFSPDGTKIRASQGHSISVDLDLEPRVPPEKLYHGTAIRFLSSIRENGLMSGKRHYVHLSLNPITAIEVGRRHGKPVVLTVFAMHMYTAGHEFYLSENGIWLTHHVPVSFISFPESGVYNA